MKVQPNQLYHIYNQGNNREVIFYDREDYLQFLMIYRKYVFKIADTICYCLMPNHFHFLINANTLSAKVIRLGPIESTELGNAFRLLCSGYANYFNKKYQRSGSLFRQKTKSKSLEVTNDINYPFICFQYIHQNPMKAGICSKMEDWEFSSFRDYLGVRKGTLCNTQLAFDFIEIEKNRFYEQSVQSIPDYQIVNLFE
ncbi:MAG: transposase [Cyclobacteriaceae bacterium]